MNCLRIALGLLVLVALVSAKGTIHVDRVYSSADRNIVIDNLVGDFANATSVSTYEVGFNAFNSLSVSAPKLTLGGSFVSVSVVNDVLFGSQNSSISLGQGSNINVNSKLISFIGNEVNVNSTNGGINFLSQNSIFVNAPDVNLQAGNGGLTFASVAGDLNVASDGSVALNSTNFHAAAHGDLYTSSVEDTAFVANGAILAFTESVANIGSSTSISIVSGSSSVEFNSDYITVASLALNATGFSDAYFRSVNEEVRVFGFNGTYVTADGININGATVGAQFTVNGFNGSFEARSTGGNVFLSTTSSDDTSEISFESYEWDAFVSRDFAVSSTGQTEINSDYEFYIQSDDFTSQVGRDGYIGSSANLTFSAGSSFGITSNNIQLLATDEGVPADQQQGDLEVTASNINHRASNSINVNTNDLLVDAGEGGINWSATVAFFAADSTDANDQYLYLKSNQLDVGTRDISFTGGSVEFNASTSAYTSSGTVDIVAAQNRGSKVEFQSKDSSWNIRQWNHDCGDCLIGPSSLTPNGVDITNFRSISFSNGDFYDVSILVRDLDWVIGDDLNFNSGNDLTLTATDKLYFSSTDDSTFASESLVSESDSFLSDSDRSTSFSATDIIFLTRRNEATDDFMTFDYSNTVTINGGGFQLNGQKGTTNFNSDGFLAQAPTITLESGDAAPAFFNANTFDFEISDSLSMTGNSLEFVSGKALSVVATSGIDITAANNGADSRTDGELIITANQDISLTVFATLGLLSDGDHVINSLNTFTSTTEQDLWIHSSLGDVTFTSTDLAGSLEFNFGGNATFATGDRVNDTFYINGNTLGLNADEVYFAVSNGPLVFNVDGSATFTSQTLNVNGASVGFVSNELIVNIGEGFTLNGGNIIFNSTNGPLTFNAGNLLSINSTDASIASKELDGLVDGLYFSAGNRITFQSQATFTPGQNDFVLYSRDSLSVAAQSPSNTGRIVFNGQLLNVTSGSTDTQFENQDLNITAQNQFVLNADLFRGEFDYDLILVANVSTQFNQADFNIDTTDSINITSIQGNFVVDHTGSAVEFNARSERFPSEANTVEINSTRFGTYNAGQGIAFTSAITSASDLRRNEDGEANPNPIFSESLVGFSIRTYDVLGDIDFDILQGDININSAQTTQFKSANHIFVDTLFEQTYKTAQASTEAQQGLIWYRGATGIELAGTRDVNYEASQYINAFADRNVQITTADDWDVNSYDSDIAVVNYEQTPISISSTTKSITLQGGSALNVEANGDLSFFAPGTGNDFSLIADRGFSLLTNTDGIVGTFAGVNNQVLSDEEIGVLAGGDLLLSNAGLGGEPMRFVGDSGVVFATRAGNIQTDATNTILDGNTIEFNAIGVSDSSRDQVLFRSLNTTDVVASNNVYIDASNRVAFGDDTNPSIISISGTGDEDLPGIEFNVAGNVELNTDNTLSFTTVDLRVSTRAQNTYTSGGKLSFTSTDQYISAPEGNIAIRSALDFVVTGNPNNGSVASDHSDELNLYQTGSIDWTATEGTFGVDAGLFKSVISGDYTIDVLAADALFQTTRDDGELEFTFGSDLTLTSLTALSFSADQYMTFEFADTTVTVAQGTVFSVDAALKGSIEFTADEAMDYTVVGDTYFNSSSLQFLSSNLDGNIALQTDTLEIESTDGDISVLTQNTITYTATTASFEAAKSFRVLADQAVSVTSATTFNFDISNSINVYTQPETGGEITFATPDFTLNSLSDVLTAFVALKGTFTATSTDTLTLDSSNKLLFQTEGEASNIETTVTDAYVSEAGSQFVVVGGNPGVHGYVALDADTISFKTLFFDVLAQADGTYSQPHSPIIISGNTHDYTATTDLNIFAYDYDPTDVGHIPVADQGTVVFTGSKLAYDLADDVTFNAENAQIRLNSLADVSFTSATTILLNTNGVKSGILFEADSYDFTGVTNLLDVNAGRQALLSVDGDITSKIVGLSTKMTITGKGESPDSGASVQFRTHDESGAISVNAATSISMSGSSVLMKGQAFTLWAAGDIDIDAGNQPVNYIDVISQGVTIIDSPLNFAGIILQGEETITVNSPVYHLESGDTLTIASATGATTATGLFGLISEGNIETTFDTYQAGTNFRARARSEGIRIDSAASIGVAVNGNSAQINAGLWEENSFLRFTAAGQNSFSASNNLDIASESNILTTARNSILTTAVDGSVRFDVIKGDVLFRSISIFEPGFDNGAPRFDLSGSAFTEIVFDPMQRLGFRQHLRLGFFTNQANRNFGNADDFSAQIQYTDMSLQNAFSTAGTNYFVNGGYYANDCTCFGGGCSSYCPDTSHRVIQMQDALVEMGFLFSDPIDFSWPSLGSFMANTGEAVNIPSL